MRLVPEWLRGGNDRQLAATTYAGRTSATDRAAQRLAERGTMGRPHPTARHADRAAARWERGDRRRFNRGAGG